MKQPDKLIMKILEAKILAGQTGRFRTMYKLDDALKEAGWELSDILQKIQKIGDKK